MIAALLLLAAVPTSLALPAPSFFDAAALSPRSGPFAATPDLATELAVSLIAYFPKITSPTKDSVWQAGGELQVSWNNSKPDYPDSQLHKFASVYLGFLNDSDPGSGYNLDVENPLGNVSFYDGSGTASLPLPADLPTRSTYLITMGSTSNISPLFTIEGSAASSASSSSSSPSEISSSSSASKAAASSSSSAYIEAPAVTIFFPDGESTVLGGLSAAALSTTATSSAPASQETALRDIAGSSASSSASSSSGSSSSPSSPAAATSAVPTASASSSSEGTSVSAAAAAAAETSSTTSGSSRLLSSGAAVVVAGALALLAL